MKSLSRNQLFVTVLVAMVIAHGYIFWSSRSEWLEGYGDFSAFYTAGSLVLHGQSSQLYDREAQWRVQQEFASHVRIRRGPLPYVRPPYEALFFVPFALWSYPVALVLWTGFKILLLFLIPVFVPAGGEWRDNFPPWSLALLSFGTLPVFMDMLQGQDSVLLAFFLALAYWQLQQGNDRSAGLVFGLGLFKFHLVLPFVAMLILGGRKRVVSGFAVMTAAVIAASAVLVGWRGIVRYPMYLLSLNRSSGTGFVTPEYQINLRGILTFFVGRTPNPGRIHWFLLPAALIAITYVGLLLRRAGDRMPAEAFGLALITATVTSYYAYSYDLNSLAVPLLAAGPRCLRGDRLSLYLERACVFLLLFAPFYWFVKRLQAEYLIAFPLLALGYALARRLRQPTTNEISETVAKPHVG